MATVGYLLDILSNVTHFEFLVEKLMVLSYEIPLSKCVCVIVGPNSLQYKDIYAYLHDNYLSPNLSYNQHKTLIRQASKYVIFGDTLCWKSLDITLLWCLNIEEEHIALREAHEGIYGAHSNGPALAKKTMCTR